MISVDLISIDEDKKEDVLFKFLFFYNQETIKNQHFDYIGESIVELNQISLGERLIKLKRITQVTMNDKEKLNEDKQLNDVVINFWINWLIMNTKDCFRHKSFYCNTYFLQIVI